MPTRKQLNKPGHREVKKKKCRFLLAMLSTSNCTVMNIIMATITF